MTGRSNLSTLLRRTIGTNVLLRRAVVWGLCAGVIAGVVTQFIPRTYLSAAKILPTTSSGGQVDAASLLSASGLSSIVGSALGGADAATLTYPDILLSEPLLVATLDTPTPVNSIGKGQNVLAALRVKGANDRERHYRGVRMLTKELEISANPRSGLIDVGIATRDSVLSAFIVTTLLQQLNHFNLATRTSQSKATREFIEGRLEQAHRDLESAEGALARFRESNLRIGNSPALLLEQSRLEREVSIRSDVFRLLSTQHEIAGIEEYRDTPTFTVIEPATPPFRKHSPSTAINVLSAGGVAAGIALLVGFVERRVSAERPSRVEPHPQPTDA